MTDTPLDNAPAESNGEPSIEKDQAELFDADYVAKLRNEAAEHRVKAKRSDDLARQLVRALTKADGRLIDADDLAYDSAYLDDDGLVDVDKVTAAIDALVERKPHLAAQRPTSTLPQGARPEPDRVDLHGILRSNA